MPLAPDRPPPLTSTAPTPSPSTRPAGLLAIVAGYLCVHAALAGLRMATPLLALQQGYGKLHVGFLVALFALGQLVLALRAGRLADVHGFRKPVALGVGLGVAAGVLATAWPVFGVLCVCATLSGASLVITMVAVQRHLGRCTTDSAIMRRAFATYSLSPPSANVVGPLLAGVVIDHLGFRAAFACLALLPALGWLALRTVGESYQGGRHGAAPGSAWDLWRDPQFRRLMIVNWLFSAGWDIYGFMVPVLGHERGFSASSIAMLMAIYAASAFAMRGVVPALTARVPEWRLLRVAAGVAAVLLAAYPLMPTFGAMAVCAAPLGMVLGGVQPVMLMLTHEMTPAPRHGQALGMRLLMMNVSSVSMPLASGLAGGLIGASGVFWAMGALMGLGPFLSTRLRPRRD